MESQNLKICIVDDEEKFLKQFSSFLRSEGFHVLIASNVKKAIDHFNQNQIAVVITDQKMPSQTGLDLLQFLEKNHPDTVRVLITGYSEMDIVVDAVNKGSIFRYINKKSNPEEILSIIKEALEKYNQDQKIKELSQMNEKLLRRLSAHSNLSLMGLFGREITNRVVEIFFGLSSYLFKEAGQENHQNIENKFAYLDQALKRLRDLSDSYENSKKEEKALISIDEVLKDEIKQLKKAASELNKNLEIDDALINSTPKINYQENNLRLCLKELLENAALFSSDKKIIIKTRQIESGLDPHTEISISNKIDPNHEIFDKDIFTPMYGSLQALHDIDLNLEEEIKKYNLSPNFHFGFGLSYALFMASAQKSWITKTLKDNTIELKLII